MTHPQPPVVALASELHWPDYAGMLVAMVGLPVDGGWRTVASCMTLTAAKPREDWHLVVDLGAVQIMRFWVPAYDAQRALEGARPDQIDLPQGALYLWSPAGAAGTRTPFAWEGPREIRRGDELDWRAMRVSCVGGGISDTLGGYAQWRKLETVLSKASHAKLAGWPDVSRELNLGDRTLDADRLALLKVYAPSYARADHQRVTAESVTVEHSPLIPQEDISIALKGVGILEGRAARASEHGLTFSWSRTGRESAVQVLLRGVVVDEVTLPAPTVDASSRKSNGSIASVSRNPEQLTIFYAWQSDLPNSTNRGFIEAALRRAAAELGKDDDLFVRPEVTKDTQGAPGSPNIPAVIFEKIDASDVFVADISTIGVAGRRPTPNPSVLVELGYAVRALWLGSRDSRAESGVWVCRRHAVRHRSASSGSVSP